VGLGIAVVSSCWKVSVVGKGWEASENIQRQNSDAWNTGIGKVKRRSGAVFLYDHMAASGIYDYRDKAGGERRVQHLEASGFPTDKNTVLDLR
jgi:hypothetical protein